MIIQKDIFVSIIIPNYNGIKLLKANLPNIIDIANKSNVNYEIIIVDDKSIDNSVNFIKNNYKNIIITENINNSGFSITCNKGAKISKGNLLLFLNNDVRLEEGFFNNIISNFEDDTIFAIVPKIIVLNDKKINESITTGYFKGGMVNFVILNNLREDLLEFNKKVEVLWACGAAFVVDKMKFFDLGGFDQVFSPGYIEDVDLSYNALKRGWKIKYEPNSVAYHDKSSTIENIYSKNDINNFYKQHIYFFIWKNITNISWIINHIFYIILRHLLLDIKEILIIWKSMKSIKKILASRLNGNARRKCSDEEIFAKFDYLNKYIL